MSNKPEVPGERFKRALAHAARSLAETPDLEVVFSGEAPSLVGRRATLPQPPRDLSGKEAARLRGLADQMALRLAHHDEAVSARQRPHDANASAVFEAIEQARIDAIGANALGGVRENLRAALEAQAALADVLGLMVRERLTGERPPDGAKALVDALAPEIEQKAGKDLDRLAAASHDQTAFGRVARAIIKDLELTDESAEDAADEASDEEPEGDNEPEPGDSDEGGQEGEQPEGGELERSDSTEAESQSVEQ